MDPLEWITRLTRFGFQYPAVAAVVLGTLSAWSLGALVEAYWLPPWMPVRDQKAWASLVTIFGAWGGAALSWGALVPTDPIDMRWIIAGVLAPTAPFSYMIGGRILTRWFPKVASVWAPPKS